MKQLDKFFAWLDGRSVWQIVASYLVGSWITLQVTADLAGVAGLPSWIGKAVLVTLAAGLIGVLATAFVQRGARLRHGLPISVTRQHLLRILSWRNLATAGVAGFALIGLVATSSFAIRRLTPGDADRRSVDAAELSQLLKLIERGRTLEAYRLAVAIEPESATEALLREFWPRIVHYTGLGTRPSGATVEIQPYDEPTSDWIELGHTPIDVVRVPIGFLRWRVSLDGYQTLIFASSGIQFPDARLHDALPLRAADDGASDMVFIPGDSVALAFPGFVDDRVQLDDYLIDRHEVTNRQYQLFVDSGGYRDPQYWREPFVRDGRALDFAEAVTSFVDRTGRPAPATWTSGRYPSGAADLPVSGISWYEAAAYLRFAGKQLPTLYHWSHVAGTALAAHIVPLANFASDGPVAVGTRQALSPFGTFDMAGNVREWCANEGPGGRYIAGGSWEDASYLFREVDIRSPWNRAPGNGVRGMRPATSRPVPELALSAPQRRADAVDWKPVPPAVFDAYRSLFTYDRSALDPRIDASTAGDGWRREVVSFRTAYDDERMMTVLWIPTTARPPLQTVIVFPGSSALAQTPVLRNHFAGVEFLIRSGRAVVLPVYKGTHERFTGLLDDDPDTTSTYRDHVIMWSKDLRRSIDYLETRSDIDTQRIAYYGLSWGAGVGPLMAALEPRLRTVVLSAGGLWNRPSRPEVDQRNFAPRVTMSVLMLNGSRDAFFPFASAQAPLFALLGTEPAHKRHIVFEGADHSMPVLDAQGEILAWLDQQLGAVR
jgi:dienelactone hydrolase